MNIKEITEEVKKLKQLAEIDVEPGPTASYKMGEKMRAKRELEQTFIFFRKELAKHSVFILLSGKNSSAISEICEKEFDTYSYYAKQMFAEMAETMDNDTYVGRSFGSSHLESIGSLTHIVATNLDVVEYPPILWKDGMSRAMSNREDIQSAIQSIHENQVGLEFTGYYFIDKSAKRALNDEFQGTTLPIVLHSDDETFMAKLAKDLSRLTPNVYLVGTEVDNSSQYRYTIDKANKKSVQELLKNIKKEVKETL